MSPVKSDESALVEDALQAFDAVNGPHSGYRPAHAKGILLAGVFIPSTDAKSLTTAPHIQRPSTRVTVRFSDGSGIPAIPDNDPNASPRGMATRFLLAEHRHTDIIAHSVNGFPAHTARELVEFLRTIPQSGPDAAKPTPIERFLAAHPAALEFVQAPKPMPASFARANFYAVTAYRFTNAAGVSVYGKYRIYPGAGAEYLDPASEAKATPNFLFDELRDRLAKGPVEMKISVQLAGAGDVVNDSTIRWPEDRRQVDFGVIEIQSIVADNEAEQQHIIFDPIPRVQGIDPSDDPLLDARASIYLASGRRRRSQHQDD
ncbi:MAG TPA: catalase family peroxidase [Bryobacteraceae bacterium]|nr:catalase family peroxidase [Bryobacteraceae bacterium]